MYMKYRHSAAIRLSIDKGSKGKRAVPVITPLPPLSPSPPWFSFAKAEAEASVVYGMDVWEGLRFVCLFFALKRVVHLSVACWLLHEFFFFIHMHGEAKMYLINYVTLSFKYS